MKPSIVVMGASLGGLAALKVILRALPAEFAIPIAVAQHRGQDEQEDSDLLAEALTRFGPLRVVDAEDKAPVESGQVVLAPAGYHLLVEDAHYALSTESTVSYARPSVDVLFESAARAYGAGVVAVVLTGTGRDGAEGVHAVKREHGRVLIQDPREAEAPSMPRAALSALGLERGLSLDEIALELAHLRGTPKGAMTHGRTRRRDDSHRR